MLPVQSANQTNRCDRYPDRDTRDLWSARWHGQETRATTCDFSVARSGDRPQRWFRELLPHKGGKACLLEVLVVGQRIIKSAI